MFEVDYSLLRNMSFNCLEECGFCCTYKPELLMNEYKFFRKNKTTKDSIERGSINDPESEDRYSFFLQNNIGACVFLKNKKCQIHNIRPLKCRTFPINIYFGWRIQLDLNLSCRGLYDGNESTNLYNIGKELFLELPVNIVRKYFSQSRKQYENMKDLNIYIPPTELRTKILNNMQNINLNHDENYDSIKNIFISNMADEEFIKLPTLLTKDLKWNVFKLENKTIQRIQLEEDGKIKMEKSLHISDVGEKAISKKAIVLIEDYIQKVVERDNFIGSIYLQALMGNKVPLLESSLKNLELIANFLILNSSMLAEFNNLDIIDKEIIENGIMLTDGTISIAPSIGQLI